MKSSRRNWVYRGRKTVDKAAGAGKRISHHGKNENMVYEYKVIAAPKKAVRGKGFRGAKDGFATALGTVMNQQAAEGWEYQRTDTLPQETRAGLTGKTTTFQNMMVFRREALVQDHGESAPEPAYAQADQNADYIPEEPGQGFENTAPSLPSVQDAQAVHHAAPGPGNARPAGTPPDPSRQD